jgi:hypothetical protein
MFDAVDGGHVGEYMDARAHGNRIAFPAKLLIFVVPAVVPAAPLSLHRDDVAEAVGLAAHTGHLVAETDVLAEIEPCCEGFEVGTILLGSKKVRGLCREAEIGKGSKVFG